MIKSSVSEEDVEEGEHSPSEVDDEGFLLTLGRFFSLANSEEDDILHLKSRCLLGIRLKTQISITIRFKEILLKCLLNRALPVEVGDLEDGLRVPPRLPLLLREERLQPATDEVV